MATQEVAERVTEQLADRLEDTAQATRQLDVRGVSFFTGGLTVGFVVGFYFGYRFNREKIKAEVFRKAEEEIQLIREHYRQKTVAAETKPTVDEVIEDRGYATRPDVPKRVHPLRPSVPMDPEPVRPQVPLTDEEQRRKYMERHPTIDKDKNDGWSYPKELAARTPDKPYVIHQDEFNENESEYQQATYTYYEADDILTDSDDDTVLNSRNYLVGEANLALFGHGADDENCVYVRNDTLEREFEICRTPKSYAEEVQGLEHSDLGENFERIQRHRRRLDADDSG